MHILPILVYQGAGIAVITIGQGLLLLALRILCRTLVRSIMLCRVLHQRQWARPTGVLKGQEDLLRDRHLFCSEDLQKASAHPL